MICKRCKEGNMEEHFPIESYSDTMTREKIDKCNKCGAYCRTVYYPGGTRKEFWLDGEDTN